MCQSQNSPHKFSFIINSLSSLHLWKNTFNIITKLQILFILKYYENINNMYLIQLNHKGPHDLVNKMATLICYFYLIYHTKEIKICNYFKILGTYSSQSKVQVIKIRYFVFVCFCKLSKIWQYCPISAGEVIFLFVLWSHIAVHSTYLGDA